ncbi:MAG: trypsin-like peptidase domain-containing protein [Candidatus Nealsonbacteria bacterium]|nr:trypsin-like peptidase domain-containing protein [Candidatus Nealsonbacteria bacterium]
MPNNKLNSSKSFDPIKNFKSKIKSKLKKFILVVFLLVLFSSLFGFCVGIVASGYYYSEIKDFLSKLNIEIPERLITYNASTTSYLPQTTQEEAVIDVVNRVSPAVVSIVISKDVPIIEEYYDNPFGDFFGEDFGLRIPQYRQKGTEKKEVGGGSGFIISEDGMILTNKHVVLDEEAEYTVLTNDGGKFSAKVLAKDPNQDLAIIKIEKKDSSFPKVQLGDSSNVKIGQTVIAIGNALGEFRNTISVGVISGLGRTVTAGGGSFVETIEDVIQTDAAINKGNSGGPLLNLKGEVIGINTATVLDAQNISFSIPVNKAKRDIEQVKSSGKIVYPFIGVYYTLITKELKEKYNLPFDYGAWIGRDKTGKETKEVVLAGSPAEKAGLKKDDIILELNNEKITTENSLAEIILKYNPGDKVTLKISRDNQEKNIDIVLGENK